MSQMLSIEDYAKSREISEPQVWQLILQGRVICRHLDRSLVIFDEEPPLEAKALPQPTMKSDETERRLNLLEEKVSSLSGIEGQELQNLKKEVEDKNEKIQQLMHDIEDLTTLSNCLQDSLSAR